MDKLKEIKTKIFEVRGVKVMFDSDVAELYQVPVKVLNQAYKRNSNRFPDDFAFRLTESEWKILRSQIVTFKFSKSKYLPTVYTEYGAWMLANILNSPIAIQTSIAIIRIFNEIRHQVLEGSWDSKPWLNVDSENILKEFTFLSQVELAVIQNCTDLGELREKLKQVVETINELVSHSPILPQHRKRIGLHVPKKKE